MVSWRFAAVLLPLLVGQLPASELRQNEAKLKVLQDRIIRLQQELRQETEQRDALRLALEQEERKIVSLRRMLRETEAKLSKQTQRLKGLEATVVKGKQDLRYQQRQLSQLVKASYMAGPQEPLRLLLNQQDPATVDRTFTYYRYIARARSEQMAQISTDLAALRRAAQDLSRVQGELQSLLTAQKQRQAKLQAKRKQRRLLLAKLERRISSDDHELRRLQGSAKHLASLLDKLQRRLSDLPVPGTGFAAMRGRLPLPVTAPIRAQFGQSRDVPGTYWRGLMFDAPAGTPVHAIFDGRVVYADWLRGFGLLLIVDHGNGYMSLYSHNQELLKGVGAEVTSGEEVALVGDSGGLTRSGLYFELRHNGTPHDPLRWCKQSR